MLGSIRAPTAVLGWIMTAATLIAGLPHFRCQCPNGSIKPVCFGLFGSSCGCCCGDVCSGGPQGRRCNAKATPARNGRTACCCEHSADRPAPQDSGGPSRLEGEGCQKTLTQPQPLARSVPAKIVQDRGLAHAAFLNTPALTSLDSAQTGTGMAGLRLSAPPPPDLVIILQHFVI
jgi:hypothetical protein